MKYANTIQSANHHDTDALEAFDSFRRCRCLFFFLLITGLLISQVSFWVVDLGGKQTVSETEPTPAAPAETNAEPDVQAVAETQPEIVTNEELAGQTDNQTRLANSLNTLIQGSLKISNYFVSIAVMIYCLALLIAMKLSIVSRLGGLACSSKAFFLSLILLVLVLPWQSLISNSVPGTLFSYNELVSRHAARQNFDNFLDYIFYYGRFVGLWVLTLVILLAAQIRSRQATRMIYQRQGIAPENKSAPQDFTLPQSNGLDPIETRDL